VIELGAHPKTLRTDQGTEYLNKEMTELLESNYVKHVVAAVNEHYSNGPAEHAVYTIRSAAKAMILHANVPRRFWCYAISHATYLNNMTSSSRMDRTKTIYEILFRRRPDVTRIPPYGAFTSIYKERRELKDQSFGLTSTQGAFIGISYHRKTLGYCTTDGTKVSCTRHHIAFDPYLYPFKLNATAPPAWQTFHNLRQENFAHALHGL
jgi:transposase InsO family protein